MIIKAKTIIFTDKQHKMFSRRQFAVISEFNKGEWFTGNMPMILGDGASINTLKRLNPKLDFRNVKMIDIEISIKDEYLK